MKKYYTEVIEQIINERQVIKATKYITPTLIVRGVRKSYGKKPMPKWHNTEITLTIGKPNYAEREMVKEFKLNKKQFGDFPIKPLMVKFYTAHANKIIKNAKKAYEKA